MLAEEGDRDALLGAEAEQRRAEADLPKPTTPPSVWIGTRARSAPSTATTTLAPSLLRYAPWLVT